MLDLVIRNAATSNKLDKDNSVLFKPPKAQQGILHRGPIMLLVLKKTKKKMMNYDIHFQKETQIISNDLYCKLK